MLAFQRLYCVPQRLFLYVPARVQSELIEDEREEQEEAKQEILSITQVRPCQM